MATTDTLNDTTAGAGAAPLEGAGGAGGPIPEGQGAPGVRPSTTDLPPDVLKYRLDQERDRGARSTLDRFGAKSHEELEAKLKRYAELEERDKQRTAEDEEKRRASMSGEERLKAENDTLKARVKELEDKLSGATGQVAAMRHGQVVQREAAEIIDPEMLDAAQLKLAAHIKELRDRGETTRIAEFDKPGKIREYFRDLATKQPKFAKPVAAAAADTEAANKTQGTKPPVARRAITNGAAPARAAPSARPVTPGANVKTLRPNQGANTMNDVEAAKHIGEKFPGVRIPGLTSVTNGAGRR